MVCAMKADRTQWEEAPEERRTMTQAETAKALHMSKDACADIERQALAKVRALFLKAGYTADDFMRL